MRDLWIRRRGEIVVVLCALAAYAAVLLGTFVYDDVHTARDNEAIRTLANIPRFFVDVDMFSSIDCRMYRPVVLTTYAVDWALGGGSPLPFKLTNLLLHAAVALVLRRLLRALGATEGAATLAAALFAAHPLASEAVNTISGRSELLVALGVSAAVLAHLRARSDRRWIVVTACATAMACGSKEIGVIVPPLLLLIDPPQWRPGRDWPRWLARHVPVALVVLGYLLLRRSIFGHATATLPALAGGSAPMSGHGRDLLTQLCTVATLLPRALAQCVLPLGLTLDPPVRYLRALSAPVVAGALFVATLTWLGLRPGPSARLRRFGVAWAWAAALPWIVLPLNLPYLEHRMYVPMLGLAAALAAAATARAARSPRSAPARTALGLVIVAYAGAAAWRSLEFRDPIALWRGEVSRQPASVRGLCGLAVCLMEAGEPEVALPLVQRAVALWPTHATALRNLAELNLKTAPSPGNAMVALVSAEAARALGPDDPFDCLLHSRALALAAEHTGCAAFYDAAEREALHCLAIAPPKSLVYRTAASARARQGDFTRALALIDASIAAGLRNAPVLLDRAHYLRRLGRAAEADTDLRSALNEFPFDPAVLAYYGSRLQVAAPPGG
ncbi:MAG: hypothetical protein R3F56_06105 [Planctomycetota bacterium]